MDLKALLKYIKLHQEQLSIVAGVLLLIIAGIFVGKYISSLRQQNSATQNITTTVKTQTHTVTKGETLWSIAQKYLGDGKNWKQLADVNNISDPSKIEIGQVLTLPNLIVPTASPVTTTKPEKTPPTPQITKEAASTSSSIQENTYTVVKGDNLWNIAVRAYGDGTKWHQIAQVNKLQNPRVIHSGNVFTIPR